MTDHWKPDSTRLEDEPASRVRTRDDRRASSGRAARAFWQRPLLPAVVAAALGTVLAGLLVGLHPLVPVDALPESLRIPLSSARLLLASLAGTIVTVIAVLFWIRSSAVQLAAVQFPANLMQRYLDDKWQRGRMALVVGTFSYLSVATWMLPEDGGGPVPHVAVLVGLGFVLASIFAVISSVSASARFMFVSEIAGRLRESLVDQIRGWDRPDGVTSNEFGPKPALTEARSVPATTSGWVRDIDESVLLSALPEGSAVWMQVRIGSFVMEDEPLAAVWSPEETGADGDEAIRRAVEIGSSRKLETDLEYGIELLADAAFRSLSPGNADITGAAEGIYQLGVVMRELVVSEAPAKVRVDQRGRRLVRDQDLTASELLSGALERVDNDAITRNPSALQTTIDVLGRLSTLCRRVDDTVSGEKIDAHLDNLVPHVDRTDVRLR